MENITTDTTHRPATGHELTDAPAPSPTPAAPAPAPDTTPAEGQDSPHPPMPGSERGLSLWELMRKDADTPGPSDDDTDDTDRVLHYARPSIWDLD